MLHDGDRAEAKDDFLVLGAPEDLERVYAQKESAPASTGHLDCQVHLPALNAAIAQHVVQCAAPVELHCEHVLLQISTFLPGCEVGEIEESRVYNVK